jgi:hypothetical protein
MVVRGRDRKVVEEESKKEKSDEIEAETFTRSIKENQHIILRRFSITVKD